MFLYPEDLPGKTIKGRYTLQKIIGQGGMGTVYLAHEANSTTPLAVKILFPKETTEHATSIYNTILERFRNEGKLIAKLRHDHIVKVYDMGEDQGMAYLVMEYLEKGTLREEIQRQKACSLITTLTYIKQAALAIDYIHQQGIIHRDIKPQNFLIGKDGQLILSDFGVVHLVGSTLTKTGEVWGTKEYVSPELASGQRPDNRDDIYSLGVILYEMLTGNHPSTIHQPYRNIPIRVTHVIKKATASQRANRYSTAIALGKALGEAIQTHNEDKEISISSTREEVLSTRQRRSIPPPQIKPRYPPQRFSSYTIQVRKLFISLLKYIPVVFILTIIFLLFYPIVFKRTEVPTLVPTFIGGDTHSITYQREATKEAEIVVRQYYAYWNEEKYQEAYNLLQSDYQNEHPFETLLPDYKQTKNVCITVGDTRSLADGSAQIAITNDAIEISPSGNTEVVNRYTLSFHVKQERGTWKIAPYDLQLVSTQGNCQET